MMNEIFWVIIGTVFMVGLLWISSIVRPINIQDVWYEGNITGIAGCKVSTKTHDNLYCCYGGCGFLGGCDYEKYCEIGDRIKYKCSKETFLGNETVERCYYNVIVLGKEVSA